ncbi:hypothetical protein NECAME_03920 [Necator americanus]|uniref:Uncharacterized protein n=1 Tax=Necator americanus TaxID=51031 RepID=W2T1F0_NECAM|nr:hypothetical protein NECAME_03920 [Necator americanus]ETN74787.1 hypothetical protein NECAME_03920 [Necator americanus]
MPEVLDEDPHRSDFVLKNSSKIGSEEKFEEDKQKGISKQDSISQTSAIKREDNVPSVSIPIPAINKLNKSHSGAGKIERRFAAGTKTSDDVLSEVERYTEKSTTTPPEASSQSSILNWFSLPSKSSLFSNLSLSNVLGKTPQENCMAPTPFASTGSEVVNSPSTPITDVATETKKTASALADVPPGLTTAVPADILSGPPPGFEGICPDSSAPPGLVFPSVSRPVFSMAPFFSNADLNKNDVGSETASKADNEWSAVGAR